MGHANVRTVTVIGVACTDIAYLFSEVVQALSAGISFRVIMVDRNHADVSNEGVLSHWEDRNLVRKEVIEPLAKQLGELRTKFENIANIKVQISQLLSSIDELDAKQELSQHSVCIRVCKKLWELADAHAKTIRSEAGTVSIYLDNELPFARQWIFGNRAVLYSAYVGYPGVGVDNPVFCYSALDDPGSNVPERALHYADQLVDKINSRGRGISASDCR